MPEALLENTFIEPTEKTENLLRGPTAFAPIHRALRGSELQQKIVNMVIDLVDSNTKSATITQFHDALRRAEEMYAMKVTERQPPSKGMSNYGSPLVRIAINTLADRIKDVTFSMPEGPAQVTAGNKKSVIENAIASMGQQMLSHVIDYPGDKEILHEGIFKTAFKAGDGWTKQSWEYDAEVNIIERDIEDPMVGVVTVEDEQLTITEFGPKMTWVDPKYIHFPEDCPDPLSAPWFVHEEYYRPEDIRRKIIMGEWATNMIVEEPAENKPLNVGDDAQKRISAHITGGEKPFKYKKVYNAYMKWKSPVDKWEHSWIFVVNVTDKQLLRGVRNKMGEVPYARYTPFPLEGQPRGESLAINLEQMWKYTNTFFNYIADTATVSVRPGGWYKARDNGLNRKNMKDVFGEYRPTQDPKNDVVERQIPDVKQGIFSAMRLLLKFYQDESGINDAVLGQFAEGVERPTARGTASLLGQISIKFENINKNIQAGLRRAYYQMFWMILEYGGDKYFERLLDESGVASYLEQESVKSLGLTPQGIITGLKSMKWDIEITGNTVAADKGAKQRRDIQLYEILMQTPVIKQRPDKQAQLINHIIKSFEARDLENFGDGLENEILMPPAQPKAETLNAQGKPITGETDLTTLPA